MFRSILQFVVLMACVKLVLCDQIVNVHCSGLSTFVINPVITDIIIIIIIL